MKFPAKPVLTAMAIMAGLFAHSTSQAEQVTFGMESDLHGIVYVDSPRAGSLRFMRGMVGQGYAIVRALRGDGCVSIPVRFAAGQLGSQRVEDPIGGPVRIVLRDATLVHDLVRGTEIISDEHTVAERGDDAEIVLVSGITEDYGFVLNPGHTFWAEIFGARTRQVDCTAMIAAFG